jgi:hypothetical protein
MVGGVPAEMYAATVFIMEFIEQPFCVRENEFLELLL